MKYYQCDLIEAAASNGETPIMPMKTTAWVKRAAAKVGASFMVEDYGKRFTVTRVYQQKPFEADELTAKQARDRNAFGSLL